jgi:cysteine desulfurase
MPRPIYLDHNATTPAFPEVIEAMRACWAEPYLNPASQHSFGRAARRVLEDARERFAQLLGAGPRDRVIFTSGGTESNNLAIRGLLQRAGASPPPSSSSPSINTQSHLITSPIEHPSITTLTDHLAETGHTVDHIPVDPNGTIRIAALPQLIRPETRLVTAMLANNETGVIQPIAELAAICNAHNIPLHTDASQAAGKLPINFRELGAATMTIAAHKFGGPIGIGALVVRGDVDLPPQLLGGFQQAGTRPGTESAALVAGMHMALELWETNRTEWKLHLDLVRREFEDGVFFPELADGQHVWDDSGEPRLELKTCKPIIIANDADRLPNTSNIALVGIDRQQLFLALDQAGIACSTGSACASGSSEPSPVHLAMGLEQAVISSALRFSFGVSTTLAEVEDAARRIIEVCNSFRR